MVGKVEIKNAKDVTRDDILKEVNGIYEDCKKQKFTDEKQVTDYLDNIMAKHKDLYSSYPLVIRHLVIDNLYFPSVFEKYLRRIEARPWKSDEERFDCYADYYIMMYKHGNPRYDQKYVTELRAWYRKKLSKEHSDFLKMHKEISKKIDERDAQLTIERRAEKARIFSLYSEKLGYKADKIAAVASSITEGKLDDEIVSAMIIDLRCQIGERYQKEKQEYLAGKIDV